MAATKACCRFFAQSQLAGQRDYVVYVFGLPSANLPGRPRQEATKKDMHGGETETSHMLVTRPDLVHMDRAEHRIRCRPGPATSARERVHRHLVVCEVSRPLLRRMGRPQPKTIGEFDMNSWSQQIAEALKAIKADR